MWFEYHFYQILVSIVWWRVGIIWGVPPAPIGNVIFFWLPSRFSLYLWFSAIWLVCLKEVFFVFILLEIYWSSWICKCMHVFHQIWAIISSKNIFCLLASPFPKDSVTCTRHFWIVSECGLIFFPQAFFPPSSDWILPIDLTSRALTLSEFFISNIVFWFFIFVLEFSHSFFLNRIYFSTEVLCHFICYKHVIPYPMKHSQNSYLKIMIC